jgi:hypothetical protein
MQHKKSRLPWLVAILVVIASVAATIVALPSIREPVLRAAGWALYRAYLRADFPDLRLATGCN